MGLKTERTKWVMFLACANHSPEPRHVLDLVYGVYCLEQAGVNPQDIQIYIDVPGQGMDGFFSNASTYPYQSKLTSDFFKDLPNNTHENLVMFISGHGGPFGLDANPPISPNQIISALKATPALGKAVLYLGQCYAGTFNYVNAGKGGGKNLEIVLAGATNLHESLSLSTSETFLNGKLPWMANVFLLNVFKWFMSPQDIDGDGLMTIMDSYKFAGIYTNYMNKQSKSDGFLNVMDSLKEYQKARDLADIDTGNAIRNMINKIERDAKFTQYMGHLTIHHVHQECWILNSRPAQKLEF